MNVISHIVAVADLHGRIPQSVPECDLLIIAGDISPNACRDYDLVQSWMNKRFKPWLEKVPARHIVGIAGNHDFVFRDRQDVIPENLRWNYLQDSGVEIEGVRIWGTPWSLRYDGWAFEAEEEELEQRYSAVPNDTDIIVSHCPPRGISDVCYAGAEHIGSKALLTRVCELRPKLVVFGHAHTGHHGPVVIVPGTVGYNVACADSLNRPAHPPTEISVQS